MACATPSYAAQLDPAAKQISLSYDFTPHLLEQPKPPAVRNGPGQEETHPPAPTFALAYFRERGKHTGLPASGWPRLQPWVSGFSVF